MKHTIQNIKRTNDKRDIMYTLYVNTVGKKSEEIMEGVRNAYPWLRNPKIIKTNYGTFRARKYSYLLSPEDFYTIKENIHKRAIYGNENAVHYLIEDKQNIFIIDRIQY